jgi:hypothetical protein
MSTWGDTRRWKVAVDGSERVQQGASSKYGMKVGNVLESRGSIEGRRECTGWCRKAGMAHLGARRHCTRQGGRTVWRTRIGRIRRVLEGTSTGGWTGGAKDGC